MAAEDRGPLVHARIGVLRGLNRNIERTLTDHKDTHWESGSLRGKNNEDHLEKAEGK